MFTIKTIFLDNINKNTIENAFRKFSIRKGNMIEFASNSDYSKIENKYFFANENDKYFSATRIKYPFENLLPRLIIKINKSNFSELKFRYSLISTVYSVFLIFISILSIIFFFKNGKSEVLIFIIIILLQIFLTIIEYKLTLKTINKIINL